MEIQSDSGYHNDPIVYVDIKPATEKQIRKYGGGAIWNIVSTPFYYIGKAMGTISMIMGGANTLKWDRIMLQKWFDKGCWLVGLKPEEPFMHTIANFLIADRHVIHGSSKVMKAIVEPHRNDLLFENSVSMNSFLELLKKMWPNENFSSDDFMMTCDTKSTEIYRSVLLKQFKSKKLKQFSPEIYDEVKKLAEKWSKAPKSVNVSIETRAFAARIICRQMFGDSSHGEQAAKSIDFFNDYLIKFLLKKNTLEDDKKFKEETIFFAKTVEEVLQKEDLPIFSEEEISIKHPLSDSIPRKEKKEPLTANQKRALIFIVFFAGQETTAALLSWTLRKLALSPELQETLHKEATKISQEKDFVSSVRKNKVIQRVFKEAIGEFPPTYRISRKIKQDLILRYRLEGETKFRKKLLRKNEIISVALFQLAEKSLKSGESNLNERNWMPFGSGKHLCPGEQLARLEILLFIYEMSLKYTMTTNNEKISKIGLVTLKTDKDIEVEVSKR